MPYGITPGSSDFPALTPAKAGRQFSNPGGMQSCKAELTYSFLEECAA